MNRLIYAINTFLLRRSKPISKPTPDTSVAEWYTDHELWNMGWHDAQWHPNPSPRFENSSPYMAGWKAAKG